MNRCLMVQKSLKKDGIWYVLHLLRVVLLTYTRAVQPRDFWTINDGFSGLPLRSCFVSPCADSFNQSCAAGKIFRKSSPAGCFGCCCRRQKKIRFVGFLPPNYKVTGGMFLIVSMGRKMLRKNLQFWETRLSSPKMGDWCQVTLVKFNGAKRYFMSG